MRKSCGALVLLALSIALPGCNTDALTPQADIPNARTTPASVNQTTDVTATAAQPGQTVMPEIGDDPPQNTLQAQAQALAAGNQPASADTLPAATTDTAIKTSTELAARETGTIRFLPIIGAPVAAVTPLSRALGRDARSNGLTIKPSKDGTAEHILKGYLSAFNDGQKTTVVYVWDVLNPSGERLNRIQGQEEVAGSARDAWSSVPPATMEAIADKTISAYLAWRKGA